MSDLVTFLRARLDEDEAGSTPRTVVVSGGHPAPEVPNCIGPDGRGGCPARWELDHPAGAGPRWWDTDETRALMAAHSMTHATPAQRRALREVEAKRRIVETYTGLWEQAKALSRAGADEGLVTTARNMYAGVMLALEELAVPYDTHPDYREEWRP